MIRTLAIAICLTGCSLIAPPHASHARRPSIAPVIVDLAATAIAAGLGVTSAVVERPVLVKGIYLEPIAMGFGELAAIFAVSADHGTNEYLAARDHRPVELAARAMAAARAGACGDARRAADELAGADPRLHAIAITDPALAACL